MKTPALGPGHSGRDVAVLHAKLRHLGFEIAAGELARQELGPATASAVREVQRRLAVDVTGVVDEETSAAIDRAITAGAGDPAARKGCWPFRRRAKDGVVIVVVPPPPTEPPGPQVTDEPRGPFVIEGTVRTPSGAPRVDGTVQALVRMLRDEREIRRSVPGADGRYRIVFEEEQLRIGETRAPLIVRFVEDDGTVGAVSPLIAAPKPVETIDLTVGGRFRGPSEHDVLVAKVQPMLAGISPAELRQDAQSHEVGFLAKATGADRIDVKYLVLAHKLAAKAEIDPQVFFAFFKQGIPASLTASLSRARDAAAIDDTELDLILRHIVELPPSNLRRAFRTGIRRNIISAELAASQEEILARLRAERVKIFSGLAFVRGKTPISDLIAVTDLPEEARRTFLEVHGGRRSTRRALRELARQPDLKTEQVDDLRFTLAAGGMLQSHLPLVRHVRELKNKERIREVRDLARLTSDDWKQALDETDPEGQEIVFLTNVDLTDEERKRHFAEILAERFERRYPTTALAARIAVDQESPIGNAAGVARFLDQNPDFQLRSVHIDRYLKENQEALAGIDDPAAVITDLKLTQRLFQLSPRYSAVKALIDNGIESAAAAYFRGKTRLIEDLQDKQGLTAGDVENIYLRAEQKYSLVLAWIGLYNAAFQLPVASVGGILGPKQPEVVEGFASLQTLFGSADYCECEHCNSVYGPAAYLADVLQFLRNRSAKPGKGKAKDVLLRRVPWIANVELSCDNTNIALPYIDLVCEILEDAVEPPGDAVVRARQSRGTAAELRAAPAFVNGAAYTKLQQAVFPLILPFHLDVEEIRTFLGHLGVPWHQLMRRFQHKDNGNTVPTAEAIAAEALGISADEHSIIIGSPIPAHPDPWSFWGLQQNGNNLVNPRTPDDPATNVTGTWIEVLRRVPVFLQRSGLTYRELLQLLDTRYVNPGHALTITDEGAEGLVRCDLTNFVIHGLGNDEDSSRALMRMQRFIRLWRKAGCTIWELDKIIAAPHIGNGAIDDDLLKHLACILELSRRVSLPLDEMLAWWDDADVTPYVDRLSDEERPIKSVYQRLFRNPAVAAPADNPFAEDPAALAGTITAVLPQIAAAISASGEDIGRVREAVGMLDQPGPAASPLTLASLSVLLRHASLARTMGISVEELLRLIDITGADPFASPAATVKTLRLQRKVGEAGFTIYEVDYLLRHGSIDRAGLHVGDDVFTTVITELRTGLQKIADENELPAREVARKRLAARPELKKPALVEQAITIIEGTWPGTGAERDAFIDTRFAGFADTVEAKAKLGDLAPGDADAQAAEVDSRYEYVAQSLIATAQVDFLRQKISDVTGLAPKVLEPFFTGGTLPGSATTFRETIEALLARDPVSKAYTNAIYRATFPDLYESFTVLQKSKVIIERLKLTAAETRWVADHAPSLGWLDLESLPATAAGAPASFEELRKLAAGVGLQHDWRRTTTFFVALEAGTAASISLAAGWDAAALAELQGPLDIAPADLRDVDTLRRLKSCFETARVLGSSVGQCLALADPAASHNGAIIARQLAKSKYRTEEWFAIAAPLQDVLREKKRDALVAWLLAHPDPANGKSWQASDDLYAYFLIDSEMSPCQLTTRLKQAAASVQLFVQRCLMHLEKDVTADVAVDDDWLQWKWMKNYRVWEANRKVFLYPENWIEPELRDDKSPFFETLEKEVVQNDITAGTAEDALLNYLERLAEVDRLQIATFFHEQDGATDLLHVIGRTVTTPHIYYYRQRLGTGEWLPWEKIDIDITGDHLVAATWNRRLHLFWPVLTEKSLDAKSGQFTIPASTANTTTPAPRKYWEIQIAWTERKRDKWTPKRITTEKLIDPDLHDRAQLHLKVFPDRGKVTIDLFWIDREPAITQFANHWGEFVIDGGGSEALPYQDKIWWLNAIDFPVERETHKYIPGASLKQVPLAPDELLYRGQTLANSKSPAVLNLREQSYGVGRTLMNAVDRPALAIPGWAMSFDARDSFFFHDPKRTFFVWPFIRGVGPTYESGVTQYRLSTFQVDGHYHPFVSTFIRELNAGGLDALYNRRLQTHPGEFHPQPVFSVADYQPTDIVKKPYWSETVDFSSSGAYSGYNWEIFFHAPLLLATRLMKNQRFEEALTWFHRIFDPTNTGTGPGGSVVGVPQRYWIAKPFFEITAEEYQQQQIEKLMEQIAQGDPEVVQQVARWRDEPFNPHLIARLRPVAYQKSVVMKYLDNLIAWGDQLFRRDTMETINEATQLYVLAADLLGRRPERVRTRQERVPKTYAELEGQFDAFSNVLQEVENVLTFRGWSPRPYKVAPKLPALAVFYFCIPPNDKLFGYWDLVADRLFKIRHCMNIEGRVRQLPLYEPPIDPALLVRARAAGVDLSTALSDVNAPLPAYRFTFMVQKATELCSDLRAFGSALLQVLEKKDAEALGALRSTHEIALLEASRDVRLQQVEEAKRNRESLDRQREIIETRKAHYEQLEFMNAAESTALALTTSALVSQALGVALDTAAGSAHLVPQFSLGGSGFGGSPHATASTGGDSFGKAAKAWADVARGVSGILSSSAAIASTLATYQRRAEDWSLQKQLAARELLQIDRQAAAADIRIAISQLELRNHERQIENAKVTEEYLRTKYTNAELYDWMITQTATTYFQTYQLAYDMARRADRSFAYETGGTDTPFIQFGYWDSLRKGLLAGEKLHYDIKRMEAAFYDRNQRELEITKHVSLAALDPIALLSLRRNGECTIDLAERLFDADYPGHYMRRIKSVALTIPAVVGPYTSLNCTLTNLSSSVRISSSAAGAYPHAGGGAGDARFRDNLGAAQGIVTSHGQNDSGVFELTLRDERYLPFEGLGAISQWHLSMPRETNRIDFDSISDVVLHVRYTARDGGKPLRDKAIAAAAAALNSGVVLLSAHHDFPDQWHLFTHPAGDDQALPLPLRREHFPFDARGRTPRVTNLTLVLTLSSDAGYTAYAAGTALKLFVTPQGGPASPVTLDVGPSQLPDGSVQWVGGRDLGDWQIRADEDDNISATTLNIDVGVGPDLHHRLDLQKIDDLLLAVGYALV